MDIRKHMLKGTHCINEQLHIILIIWHPSQDAQDCWFTICDPSVNVLFFGLGFVAEKNT